MCCPDLTSGRGTSAVPHRRGMWSAGACLSFIRRGAVRRGGLRPAKMLGIDRAIRLACAVGPCSFHLAHIMLAPHRAQHAAPLRNLLARRRAMRALFVIGGDASWRGGKCAVVL